jgi:hypothetical protein
MDRSINIISGASFSLEGFLLSALLAFPEVNSKGEKKIEQVKRYASILVNQELSGEKTLYLISEKGLVADGIPRGHAIAIVKAAQRYSQQECKFLFQEITEHPVQETL